MLQKKKISMRLTIRKEIVQLILGLTLVRINKVQTILDVLESSGQISINQKIGLKVLKQKHNFIL